IPKNQQIVPRDVESNTAVIAISGKETAGGCESVTLRCFRDGVVHGPDVVVPLQYVNGEASFSFTPTITGGLISHDFEIHVTREGSSHLVRRVTNVSAGD